jgi:hypothetical protein
MNVIMCKAFAYLLSIFTRSTYWLLSLVTIERLYLVLRPTNNMFKRSNITICLTIVTITIVFSMHIHEIFYYTIVKDSNNQTLCVINFEQAHILLYDRVTVLFHSLGPFIIQVVSVTRLIVLITQSRAKTRREGKNVSFNNLLMQQFKKQKELYINPAIIILSALPQIVLSFSIACTELSSAWQRYLLLITYFLSYLPQMISLVLHILPSTLYKREFHETSLYKNIFRRLLNHDEINRNRYGGRRNMD